MINLPRPLKCVALLAWFVSSACFADGPDPYRTAHEIDRLLVKETIGESSAKLAARSDDETFLRRAFLDLLGKPPTPSDVLAFCLDSKPEKRQQLVEQLLAERDFGANWGRYWRDVIMFRRTEDRALLAVSSLTSYLEKQLNENRPWNETATALITASGDVTENGDAGLIVAQAGMPEDIVSEVSRIFLGVQIQCAQCHDHPTDRWKREQFHHMAAFFPRVGLRLNPADRTLVVTTIDSAFRRRPQNNNNRFFGTLEHYMPDKNDPSSQGTMMAPVFFLTEQKLDIGVRDTDRRSTLADWITTRENPWFAKAFVNRIWSELIGEGFYEPVDDMGPDRDHTAPETLEYLSKAFAETGYDVKWFYRTVLATEAYQRQSRSRRTAEEAPFVASCAQRLRADQLFSSLLTVLNLEGRLPQRPANMGPMFRRDPQFQFNQVFGYDPSDPRAEVASSIPQALTLMNSPMFHGALSAQRPDALGRILQKNRDNEAALSELYVTTLGRTPSQFESDTCLVYICDVGNRNEAFEDIFWSLINSTEFSYRK
jgi:hypothetical protein